MLKYILQYRLTGSVAIIATALLCGSIHTQALSPTIEDVHGIFVTAETYTADLGGITGADATCTSIALLAGLTGDWNAILSDSSTSAKNRIKGLNPVHNMAGRRVASSVNSLWNGGILTPIQIDELGNFTSPGNVWTGTDKNGIADSANNTNYCQNWTSRLGTVETGRNSMSNGAWVSRYGDSASSGFKCIDKARLYCISAEASFKVGMEGNTFINTCGNSTLELGEYCDDGSENGEMGKCNSGCTGIVPLHPCMNGIDDDGDGQPDEIDPGCNEFYNPDGTTNPPQSTLDPGCGNGIIEYAFSELCDDGNNDDGDGCSWNCRIECGDGVCSGIESCRNCQADCPCGEIGASCADSIDNDNDGNSDCSDTDCFYEIACKTKVTTTELVCNDNLDDDGDGDFDCDDPDCVSMCTVCGDGICEAIEAATESCMIDCNPEDLPDPEPVQEEDEDENSSFFESISASITGKGEKKRNEKVNDGVITEQEFDAHDEHEKANLVAELNKVINGNKAVAMHVEQAKDKASRPTLTATLTGQKEEELNYKKQFIVFVQGIQNARLRLKDVFEFVCKHPSSSFALRKKPYYKKLLTEIDNYNLDFVKKATPKEQITSNDIRAIREFMAFFEITSIEEELQEKKRTSWFSIFGKVFANTAKENDSEGVTGQQALTNIITAEYINAGRTLKAVTDLSTDIVQEHPHQYARIKDLEGSSRIIADFAGIKKEELDKKLRSIEESLESPSADILISATKTIRKIKEDIAGEEYEKREMKNIKTMQTAGWNPIELINNDEETSEELAQKILENDMYSSLAKNNIEEQKHTVVELVDKEWSENMNAARNRMTSEELNTAEETISLWRESVKEIQTVHELVQALDKMNTFFTSLNETAFLKGNSFQRFWWNLKIKTNLI